MAATVRSASTYASAANDTSVAITLPAGWQPGDVCYVFGELRAATGTLSTSTPGWTTLTASFASGSSTSSAMALFRRVLQTGDTTGPTITCTSGRLSAIAVAVQGADNGTPEDGVTVLTNNNGASAVTSVAGSAITPNGAADLLLCGYGCGDPTTANTSITFGTPASMTIAAQVGSTQAAATDSAVMVASQALTSNAQVTPGSSTVTTAAANNAVNGQAITLVVLSAPSGGGAVQALPGRTWLRRFHHQQQQPPPVSVITAVVSGPPVYPLGHPIQAKQYPPLQGGRTSNRRGVFAQAGPPVRMWDGPVASVQPRVLPPHGRVTGRRGAYGQAGPPVRIWTGPVQARPPLGRGGHVATRTGFYGQTGPPVRQWDSPVRAPIPAPVRGGRVASRDGVFAQAGPPVRQWHAPVGVGRQQLPQPVRGRIVTRAGTFVTVVTGAGPPVYPLGHPVQAKRWPTRGGSVTTRDGTFSQAGPQVHVWNGPVQARQPLPARGRTSNRSGTFTFVATGQGPPVYPLGHPVQAKRLPIRGGQNASRDGTFDQQGPAVRQWDGPVQARQPLPPRGRAQGRAGTFTFVATGQGPPIYPLGHPVQAKRQPLTGGRVVRRAGTFAQAGPPARVWHAPAGVGRQQPPPPTRGRTGSQRGPYAQTGPKVRPLQGPVRGRLPGPYRSGRSDSTLLPPVAVPPPLISVATGTATVSDPRSGITSVADPRSGIPSVAEAATGITSATDPRSGTATVADPRDGPGGSVG